MRRGALLAVLTGLAVAAAGCDRSPDQSPSASTTPATAAAAGRTSSTQSQPAPPKDDGPLLLLDDDPATRTATGPLADNSRCHVCHLNYTQEALALGHAKANIGCAQCHGPSDAHIADESWAAGGNGTAPDIMYPLDKINPACLACHPKEKIDDGFHRSFWAGESKEKHCTDCHGKHRLATRKCRWK